MPTIDKAWAWANQTDDGRYYPETLTGDTFDEDEFDPYSFLGGDRGLFFPDDDGPLLVTNATLHPSAIGGPTLGTLGVGGALAPTTASDYDLASDLPLGPVTCMFRDGGSPMQAASFGFAMLLAGSAGWSDDPLDNLTMTPLDSDGTDLDTAVTLATLGTQPFAFTGIYDFGGDPFSGLLTFDDAQFYDAMPCYGFRVEHTDPGNENPWTTVLRFVFFAGVGERPWLRQRQSPKANPRVSLNRPQLRQRQRFQ